MYSLKFTDGTKIPLVGISPTTPYTRETYKRAVLAIANNGLYNTLFTGTKTDKNGNTITISVEDNNVVVTVAIAGYTTLTFTLSINSLGMVFFMGLYTENELTGFRVCAVVSTNIIICINGQDVNGDSFYAYTGAECCYNGITATLDCEIYYGRFTYPTGVGGTNLPISYFDVTTGEPDPYEEQPTTEGGGDGNRDNTSDPIAIPALPVTSAAITGFVTVYTPSLSQLWNLAEYMWSNDFDLITFKALFNAPMDAIFGLNILPFEVTSGGSRLVVIGNMVSEVTMDVASSQYQEIDCGSITIEEFWGSYLDYAPYTKAELYLPFVGTHPIDIDDIMGKTIQIVYHVDILSGGCIAMVKSGDSVLYNFSGHCSVNAPISGANFNQAVRAAVSTAVSVGMMVATGGTSAAAGTGAKVGNALASAGAASVNNAVSQFKPSIEKSGAIGNAAGLLGIRKPYIILTRPRQAIAKDQNSFYGYPSHIAKTLSSLTGYTEVDSIHLEGIPATQGEYSEIEKLLMEGVIL